MSLRSTLRFSSGRQSNTDEDDYYQQQQDMMNESNNNIDNVDEDDNAAEDVGADTTTAEDPLWLAIDDLEGRVASAMEDVKLHEFTDSVDSKTMAYELQTLLRPVLEVAAHTGPSIARTYFSRSDGGLESALQMAYERTVSDLVLPVLLELAREEEQYSFAHRIASLEAFKQMWLEWHKAGSWLDDTVPIGLPQQGPYGNGGSGSSSSNSGSTIQQLPRLLLKQRRDERLTREAEFLRYWIQAGVSCTAKVYSANDNLTDENSAARIQLSHTGARAIISASSILRPSLNHIAARIQDADDRGANRLYAPMMKLIQNVIRQVLTNITLSGTGTNDEILPPPSQPVLGAAIKFIEIVTLCFSRKPPETNQSRNQRQTQRKGANMPGKSTADFSLDDLPEGHPVITRDALSSVGDYAFTTLRGWLLLGGQSKIEAMSSNYAKDTPSDQVVSLFKPAALAFLEIDSSLPKDKVEVTIDRSNIEYEFQLSQKPYALVMNAVSTLCLYRPAFFRNGALCMSRRAATPIEVNAQLDVTSYTASALTTHIRSICVTLLRNSLSVSTESDEYLMEALRLSDMETQANNALSTAKRTIKLMGGSRAEQAKAKTYYTWETTDVQNDALKQLRSAKAARGLGQGIQLPTSMSDSIELILVNLGNLPVKKPASTAKANTRRKQMTLDLLLDAVQTNGACLMQEEGRWYDRDGGLAWVRLDDGKINPEFGLHETMKDTMKLISSSLSSPGTKRELDDDKPASKRQKLYHDQCNTAASDAFSRILNTTASFRSRKLIDFGNQTTARLAFTLRHVLPASVQQPYLVHAKEAISSLTETLGDNTAQLRADKFIVSYPLASSAVAMKTAVEVSGDAMEKTDFSLGEALLNEAIVQSKLVESSPDLYDACLDVYLSSAVHASNLANEKPMDEKRKELALQSALNLQDLFSRLPLVTETSLYILCAMCNTDASIKKSLEAARKSTQDSASIGAAAHAAKVAAEKRATVVLLILKDIALQRDYPSTRDIAVKCAVGLAGGRIPSSAAIQDKALKLVMNVIFAKGETLEECVINAATDELQYASNLAVESYDAIQKANKEASVQNLRQKNAFAPRSEDEKKLIDQLKKVALLFMALCVRKTSLIDQLFQSCCVEKADILSKTVRSCMSKLARAAAIKYGAASIAIEVAAMTRPNEVTMLLSFLENLVPTPEQDLIDACFMIQQSKSDKNGNKDPRYIIPIISAMKRHVLVDKLPEFVVAEDDVFLQALEKMSDKVGRQALLFREEPDEENPALHGMTLCEQLVYLHKLDFTSAMIPQKRYLLSIKLCLEHDDVFSDRIWMSALDYMSGVFLTSQEKLPLAFMRTCILVCSKHESLHSWIAHVLLPRLVEAKVYEDARQWEGFQRCAHMLEKSGEAGVNASEALNKLPQEQMMQYRTKWAGK